MYALRTTTVDNPAAWTGSDMALRRDWVWQLTNEEADEISTAVAFNHDRPILEITKEDFLLPKLSARMGKIIESVDQGVGIALIRGVPITNMDEDDAARALWGLGRHVGQPQIQDAARSLLHHVRDTGGDWQINPRMRVYETNAEQVFHNDGGDLVMLLCRHAAKSGGASRMVSAVTLFNEVIQRAPDLAEALQFPFPFDARGQQLPGCPDVQHVPIFVWHAGRLNALHKRHYIKMAERFDDIPPLSGAQIKALDLIDEICADPAVQLSFNLEPGDIQVASNFTILHARDAFEDFDEPARKRHMLRLWLGLDNGRPLPEIYRSTREFGPLFEIEGRASGAAEHNHP